MTLTGKDFYEAEYQSYNRIQIVVRNNGEKDIRAVKGWLVLADLFDDVFVRLEVKLDDPIPAGGHHRALEVT